MNQPDILCVGPEDGLTCFAKIHGPCLASYERMNSAGEYRPVCYECAKVSRRKGWRVRNLRPRKESH